MKNKNAFALLGIVLLGAFLMNKKAMPPETVNPEDDEDGGENEPILVDVTVRPGANATVPLASNTPISIGVPNRNINIRRDY